MEKEIIFLGVETLVTGWCRLFEHIFVVVDNNFSLAVYLNL
jgi:hypothetical protein